MIVRRKRLRLSNFDYSQDGAYFITICTQGRKNCLARIEHGLLFVDDMGRIVQKTWDELPSRFPGVLVDASIVMPNHFHGIILLDKGEEGVMNHAPTLGELVRTWKAVSTRLIRKFQADFAWQRNYYEHVIRDEKSLNRIREYIATNPSRWELDRENPQSQGRDDFDIWLSSFKSRPVRVPR